jgi:hypothetical protein
MERTIPPRRRLLQRFREEASLDELDQQELTIELLEDALAQRILLGVVTSAARRPPVVALESLTGAEDAFFASDIHGRSVAAYRRALALEGAGRCEEAAYEFKHYAELVQPAEPLMAEHALAYLQFCVAAAPKSF